MTPEELVAAQKVARTWLERSSGAVQRRWRNDASSLALSGAVPALGHLLFGWSAGAMFAAFLIDLAVAWFWDVVKLLVASRACERELRWLLAAERALRIARAVRAREHSASPVEMPPERVVRRPLGRFALGYGTLAFATICALAVPVFWLMLDYKSSFGWPEPLWPVLIPVLARSVLAIVDLRDGPTEDGASPQVLPQALGQSLALLLAWIGIFVLAALLARFDARLPGTFMSPVMCIVAYGIAATAIAALLAAQLRRGRDVLAWFAALDRARIVDTHAPP